MNSDSPPTAVSGLRIWMWRFIFAGHVVAPLAWWYLMPGGFPWSNVRAWTNGVLPWFIAAAALAGRRGLVRRPPTPAPGLVAAVPVLWAAVFVTSCVLYPESLRGFGLLAAGALTAFAASWWFLTPTTRRVPLRQAWLLVAAAALGIVYPWSLRGPDPSTLPLNATPPDFTYGPETDTNIDSVGRGPRVDIRPERAEVMFDADVAHITVQPLLTFISRSPDRFWTCFASPEDRAGPARSFAGRLSVADFALFRYLDDGTHVLRVCSKRDSDLCEIDAFSSYPNDVYSHLNTYCRVTIESNVDLRLAFSPCRETPIAVRQADYPFGRPAQFGYLRKDGMFVIVEAKSAEKGPFRTLAEGPLERDGHLGVGLEFLGEPVATLVFEDWAAQAGTELSPSAGWGVPQNAVEFQRYDDEGTTLIDFWLTLAGTSVGRGFDSVGHRAGTYRNRIRIELPE